MRRTRFLLTAAALTMVGVSLAGRTGIPEASALASRPITEVVPSGHPQGWSDKSYYLPMRDGVRVALSFYFPHNTPPKMPATTILIQTRYGRATQAKAAKPWTDAGYAVAVVDTRGSTSSFGPRDADIGPDEVRDMDDIIAHVASRPWANGKIIAFGVSYMADTADMATSRPAPALVGSIPRETDFDTYLDLFNPGGVANDFMMQDWGGYTYEIDLGRDGRGKGLDCHERMADCAGMFPVLQPVDGDSDYALLREALDRRKRWKPSDYDKAEFRDDIAGNGYPLFASAPAAHLAGIRHEHKPVQYWGSWVDGGTAEAALARFRSIPDLPAEIWITANNHGHMIGADPLRPTDKAAVPSVAEQESINQAFARKVAVGQPIERLIHYYVMGAGVFRTTETWPIADVVNQRYVLSEGHRLARKSGKLHIDYYKVDWAATTGKATRWSTQFNTPPDYPDRREEDRKLTVYDTEPMVQDMEVAGNPVITLIVSTQTTDPAFFIYFEDVAPNGWVGYLTEGELRAINRKPADPTSLPYDQGSAPHSFKRADALPITPGRVMELRFALFPTAALIRKGHRLRVAIAGTDADTFHRYSNGKADRFDVHMGGGAGSVIDIPMRAWKP